jgi:hypothetical protein
MCIFDLVKSGRESHMPPSNAKNSPPKTPAFPAVVTINGRGFITRLALEIYKSELIAASLGGDPKPVSLAPIEATSLVPLKVVAAELGTGRRSVGRRIAASRSDSKAA